MQEEIITQPENIQHDVNSTEVKSIFSCWYDALAHFFDSKGRVSCYEYWAFQTVNVLIFILAAFIGWLFSAYKIVFEILALYFIIPVSFISARRLHDLGLSGKWAIPNSVLALIAVVLWDMQSNYAIIFAYALLVYSTFLSWILISAGEEQNNIYGEKVQEAEFYTQDSIFFIRFMAILLAFLWLFFLIKVF